MSLVLRSEKGSNLTPNEVDGNFTFLQSLINDLVANPPAAVSVVGFSVTGRTFRVNLSNGSQFGPYDLPTTAIEFAGDWTPGATYSFMNMFRVPNMGLYLVVADTYTAPPVDTDGNWPTFDPDQQTTEGFSIFTPVFESALPVTIYQHESTFTLFPNEANAYHAVNSASGVLCQIPLDDPGQPFRVGDWFTIQAEGTGAVAIDPLDSGITVRSPESLILRKQYSTAVLTYRGNDTWDLSGDLEEL